MEKKHYCIAAVYGMCGGVFAALRILEKVIGEAGGKKVYVLHELVHNVTVTSGFESRGVIFVDRVEDIPPGSCAVIGAHGVSREVEAALRAKCSVVTDATCPLVKKLQHSAAAVPPDEELVIYGKAGHPEVSGVAGHAETGKVYIVYSEKDIASLPELSAPHFLSQTTVDAGKSEAAMKILKQRFPGIHCVPGVCDASRQRQAAVAELSAVCPVVLIAGSAHSSNACRLREIAEQSGAAAFRIDEPAELPEGILEKTPLVGISAGASTPEEVLKKIICRLEELGFEALEKIPGKGIFK